MRYPIRTASSMAPPAGFEPATLGLEVPCSIQLSYGGVCRRRSRHYSQHARCGAHHISPHTASPQNLPGAGGRSAHWSKTPSKYAAEILARKAGTVCREIPCQSFVQGFGLPDCSRRLDPAAPCSAPPPRALPSPCRSMPCRPLPPPSCPAGPMPSIPCPPCPLHEKSQNSDCAGVARRVFW